METVVNRLAGVWFVGTGATGLILWALFSLILGDAEYYAADSFGDYAAVVAVTLILVITGIPLILLWRNPPVGRGAFLLLLAGIGIIAEGIGNLLEDIFGLDQAVLLFFGGGMLYMVSLLIAGVLAFTVSGPQRWSGLFLLLGVPAGMLGFGWVIAGVSWVLFGGWLITASQKFVTAMAVAAVPLLALGVVVNL
jgi:hypothetical protein